MEQYVIIVALFLLIVITIYSLWIDTRTREHMYRNQMEMAIAQQAMTKELTWAELKKILDEIMNFTCSNYITINGLRNMPDDEISLSWIGILNDISISVELSISDELRRQILKNVSLMYLTKYIKDSVQLLVVLDLEKNRTNVINRKLEYYQTGNNPKFHKKTSQTK